MPDGTYESEVGAGDVGQRVGAAGARPDASTAFSAPRHRRCSISSFALIASTPSASVLQELHRALAPLAPG